MDAAQQSQNLRATTGMYGKTLSSISLINFSAQVGSQTETQHTHSEIHSLNTIIAQQASCL